MPKRDINQEVYQSSLDVLRTAGLPSDIAEKASEIVASDDPTKPDLGRTAEDQEVVKQVVEHFNEGWRNAK